MHVGQFCDEAIHQVNRVGILAHRPDQRFELGVLRVGGETVGAAVGARCILLFGPTDPAIWAPANKNVTVLRAPEGQITRLALGVVACAVASALGQSVR